MVSLQFVLLLFVVFDLLLAVVFAHESSLTFS
jgi:hypothetical protein